MIFKQQHFEACLGFGVQGLAFGFWLSHRPRPYHLLKNPQKTQHVLPYKSKTGIIVLYLFFFFRGGGGGGVGGS